MKPVEDFYNEFKEIFRREDKFNLLEEFQKKIEDTGAKEVFLWLQEKSERGDIPKEMEPLLTDFFYSIH